MAYMIFKFVAGIMERIVEQNLLYDFYGELLNDHQKKIYEDAIYNDLSLSEIADEYGISRQGVEIPFINFENIEEVRAALADGGVKPGVCGPRVRTVTACQGNEVCPSGCINTYELAKKLDEHYFGRELPHKFKFGVTGCQNNCLKAEENDIGVKGGMDVTWVEDKCINCGVCEKACRMGAISCANNTVTIDRTKCNNCGRCVKACPTEAWEGQSGYIVSFVVACVMVLVLVVRRWLQPENINSTYIAWSDSKGYTMGYFLKNPIQFFEILLNTLWYESGKHIQQMLGNYLGWLDIEVPLVFVIGFLLLLLYVSIRKENEEQLITVGDRIWMLLVFVGVSGLAVAAMLLYWTPYQFVVVAGVQGRYFLPARTFFFSVPRVLGRHTLQIV